MFYNERFCLYYFKFHMCCNAYFTWLVNPDKLNYAYCHQYCLVFLILKNFTTAYNNH